MSYQRERDEFIAKAVSEGLTLDVTRRLLRYASTLQRLAVAQCNGDWPYNGDRDRPSRVFESPGHLDVTGAWLPSEGETEASKKAIERHDRRYTVCPKCETGGVNKSAMRTTSDKSLVSVPRPMKVCPDCRTRELVKALLHSENTGRECVNSKCPCFTQIKPVFNGDPRGAVLRLATPGFPVVGMMGGRVMGFMCQ
jgi:hypothetical protein